MVDWKKRVLTGVVVLPLLYTIVQNNIALLLMYIPMFYITQSEYLNLLKHIQLKIFSQIQNPNLKSFIEDIHFPKPQYAPLILYFILNCFSNSTSHETILFNLFICSLILVIYRIVLYIYFSGGYETILDKQKDGNAEKKEIEKQNADFYLITFVQIAGDIFSMWFYVYPFGLPQLF